MAELHFNIDGPCWVLTHNEYWALREKLLETFSFPEDAIEEAENGKGLSLYTGDFYSYLLLRIFLREHSITQQISSVN